MSKLFAGRRTSAAARTTSRNWRWIGGISLAVLLLFAPLALADPGGPPSPTQGPDPIDTKACEILNGTKLPGISQFTPGAKDVLPLTPIADIGCETGRCFDQRTDPNTGSTICHYSRAALVALGCHPSKHAATALVENLIRRHHFRRVRLNVDTAAVGMEPNGAGIPSAGNPSNTREVAMALGRETVAFVMHVGSDDDPNPTWPGIQRAALQGARNTIPYWKILPKGCPGA